MDDKLRLMCVLAHPDDESLGTGGTLAKYSREGVETYLLTATRGERGRCGGCDENADIEEVGRIREAELRNAASALGIKNVSFLDYVDKELDQANPAEALAKIVYHLRDKKPDIVITFGPEGAYGHPDHIAIGQFTTAAIINAADPNYRGAKNISVPSESHRVSKLYYMSWSKPKWDAYRAAFRDLKTTIDGVERRATPTPDWIITTVIDTTEYWETVWSAVQCHKTQLTIYGKLAEPPEEHHRAIWGSQEYYRVFSIVNGGRRKENDLFEGLRQHKRDYAEHASAK
jgi:LmbE family N-acetylglucosaminyl deacetylase